MLHRQFTIGGLSKEGWATHWMSPAAYSASVNEKKAFDISSPILSFVYTEKEQHTSEFQSTGAHGRVDGSNHGANLDDGAEHSAKSHHQSV